MTAQRYISSTLELSSEPVRSAVTRPRMSKRRIAAFIAGAIVALLALTVAAGAAFEAIASRNDAGPAGQLVDVGGYRLHIDCSGSGPAVIMDAGLGSASLDWVMVQPALQGSATVCVYDRAGMGWSDKAPDGARTPLVLAEELRQLLINARIPGPYVLVGHSLAGKNLRMFAKTYPADVAGMVLVDARSEQVDALTTPEEFEGFKAALTGEAQLFSLARPIGLVRFIGADVLIGAEVPKDLATRMALLKTQPAAIDETVREGIERAADDKALAESTLGSMPLVVVASRKNMDHVKGWADAQAAMAKLSDRGRLVIADTGHAVHLEKPEVVISAVRDVLSQL